MHSSTANILHAPIPQRRRLEQKQAWAPQRVPNGDYHSAFSFSQVPTLLAADGGKFLSNPEKSSINKATLFAQ